MKKIAYWSSDEKPIKPQKDVPVSLIGGDSESATENAGRFGFNALEMTREPLLFGGKDPDHYEEGVEKEERGEEVMDKDLVDLLVFLGDEMDKEGDVRLANFADFLLKKIAQTPEVDYTDKYNQLMIKINNSDIVDRNDTIKKLTKIYSRTLALEFMKQDDVERAKESAFKKVLHRADQYLGES